MNLYTLYYVGIYTAIPMYFISNRIIFLCNLTQNHRIVLTLLQYMNMFQITVVKIIYSTIGKIVILKTHFSVG